MVSKNLRKYSVLEIPLEEVEFFDKYYKFIPTEKQLNLIKNKSSKFSHREGCTTILAYLLIFNTIMKSKTCLFVVDTKQQVKDVTNGIYDLISEYEVISNTLIGNKIDLFTVTTHESLIWTSNEYVPLLDKFDVILLDSVPMFKLYYTPELIYTTNRT